VTGQAFRALPHLGGGEVLEIGRKAAHEPGSESGPRVVRLVTLRDLLLHTNLVGSRLQRPHKHGQTSNAHRNEQQQSSAQSFEAQKRAHRSVPDPNRRLALFGIAATVFAGCARPARRPRTTAEAEPVATPQQWNADAKDMLLDSLAALRTFDDYQAFRMSTAAASEARPGSELSWDPPTLKAWDAATRVARGFPVRAEQFFRSITAATIDQNLWRERRSAADAAHDLGDLGSALVAYRSRLDLLRPGDASGALGLLNEAWARWEAAAARWGLSRAETIGCAG
jgi:hypothetical protein